MFYAPWCGYCKEMKPSYAAAAKALKMENSKIVFAALDATKYRELSEKEEIKGYPTCNTAFVFGFLNHSPQQRYRLVIVVTC